MRIQALHLIAFGPFTNTVIDLERGREGLHIIYGPNESGKSSSLRALHQVLYGIPAKSTDNFRHAHPDMRIGIVLKHSDGSILKVVRRKGNSKTLRKLDSENDIVDPAVLQRYLGNINQSTFENMFGIDHPTLVSGGEAILKGNGELGQLLFSAGAGITDLRSVLAGLEKDFQELYARGGSTRVINKQLSEYAEAKKLLREAELPNSEWERHEQALNQALRRKEQIDAELTKNQIESSRLRRFRSAVPLIAERSLYLAQLSELETVPALSDSFEDEARALLEQWHVFMREDEHDEAKILELRAELSQLKVPPGLIERASNIEVLQQRLGSHQKAALDRQSLEQALVEEKERARACLRDLGRSDDFESASALRMSVQEKTRLRKLALERRALWQAYSDAQSLRQRTELRLRQASDELVKLANLPDCEKLLVCTKRIQQDPQIEERLLAEKHRLERQFKQICLDLKKLQLSGLKDYTELAEAGELHDFVQSLYLPEAESIDVFERDFLQLSKEVESLRGRRAELGAELFDLQCRLQEHELKIAAPTEADLIKMRRLRDDGWRLVLKSWKESTQDEEELCRYLKEVNASGDLTGAYEWAQQKSDTVADRLRHEADHVAQKVQLAAQVQKLQASLVEIDQKLEERQRQVSALTEDWEKLWHGVCRRKMSAASARICLSQFGNLRESLAELLTALDQLKFNSVLVERSKSELRDALSEATGNSMEESALLLNLLDKAQRCLDNLRTQKQAQAELEKELSKLQADLASNAVTEQTRKTELDSWAASWHPSVEQLGLGPTTSPEELTAFLDRLEQYFSHYDQMSNLKRRITAIVRDAEDFHADVKQTVERLLSEQKENSFADDSLLRLAEAGPEEAALELYSLLKRAKETAQRKTALEKQEAELVVAAGARRQAKARLKERLLLMVAEAGVQSESELIEVSKRAKSRKRLEELKDSYDRQLLRLAEGTQLESFISEAQCQSVDLLEIELSKIEADVNRLEKERDEVQILIGSRKQILNTMDGRADAAEAADRLQQVLAELGQNVEQYARLKIAAFILKNAIDRYREKNQSPILRKASEIFSRLSNGAFQALQEDFNEKGEPVLFGLRAGSATLTPIEGMSEGTCDQVYLALRLAGLSLFLDREEALPFIVDDILVNFDDERALSTLKVLAEFSSRTQIIMFTHHAHIVSLCKKHLNQEQVFINELGAAVADTDQSYNLSMLLQQTPALS